MLKRIILCALAGLGACSLESRAPQSGQTAAPSDTTAVPALPMQPIDPAIPPAVAGQDGWNYQQSAEADLTGDGAAERVILTARVEMVRGRPAWDDGQPWQVYVETTEGRRTYLYAQRLQLGSLAMRIAVHPGGQPSTIVLLEHLPDRLTVYEATYTRPGEVMVAVRFQRNLDPRGESASPLLP